MAGDRLTWQVIRGSIPGFRLHMYASRGYLIVPQARSTDGGIQTYNWCLHVPSSDGASLVFWCSCDTLVNAKRVARGHFNKRQQRGG